MYEMDWGLFWFLAITGGVVKFSYVLVFWFNDWLDYYRGELYRFHHEKIGLEENDASNHERNN